MGHSSSNESFEKFGKKNRREDRDEEKRGSKRKKPWARNRMKEWEEHGNDDEPTYRKYER